MPAIDTLMLPFLNRLLEHEDWPRQRLSPFIGQTARIEGGPLKLALTVNENGLFSLAAQDSSPEVIISFGADAPFKLFADPGSVFTSARLSGAANFAETLAFVFRNLRWDYEGYLAGFFGDIPGRRLARLLANGAHWHRSAVQRLGTNVSEYVTEESQLLTPGREIAQFCASVDHLRDDLARLEKRLARLSQ
jgi:ubiquinone biosynthesis accessory factor UbiJ